MGDLILGVILQYMHGFCLFKVFLMVGKRLRVIAYHGHTMCRCGGSSAGLGSSAGGSGSTDGGVAHEKG